MAQMAADEEGQKSQGVAFSNPMFVRLRIMGDPPGTPHEKHLRPSASSAD
jgi:hypothetical protein